MIIPKINIYLGIGFIILAIVYYIWSPIFIKRAPIEWVVLEKLNTNQYKINKEERIEIKQLAEYAIAANAKAFQIAYFNASIFIVSGILLISMGAIQIRISNKIGRAN